jgi:D-alanyl-D-alanine carboxypeptidase (penicillin-binding protein 5/6)
MMPRAVRWLLAGAGVAALLAPGVLLFRSDDRNVPGGVQALAGGDFARDPIHTPWFGLSLLHRHRQFSGPATEPIGLPPIDAEGGILVDPDTGRILWQHNAHRALPPASTIKMLTAMVVLQNFPATRVITATRSALRQAADETTLGLQPGDRLTVRELLSAMLMVSANDAAEVFAHNTVGRDRFIGAMNAQVAALDLHDTHAASPVGLDDPGTYASAYDLAVIAAVDVDAFPLFAAIVNTRTMTIPASAHHAGFELNNLNQLLTKYPAATGVKPGWTGDAGACEVGMAVRGGHRLISVLLHGTLVYTETARLLDWGFAQEGLPRLLPLPAQQTRNATSPH